MATTARALAAPLPFEFEGATYKVAPWTYDVQAEFENYLVGRAYARLRAQRAELGAEYEAERAALRRDVDAGRYEFGGELAQESLNRSGENVAHLFYLCLAYAHKDDRGKVSRALAERVFQDPDKAREALEVMFEVNRDPNSPPAGEPPAPPAAP